MCERERAREREGEVVIALKGDVVLRWIWQDLKAGPQLQGGREGGWGGWGKNLMLDLNGE